MKEDDFKNFDEFKDTVEYEEFKQWKKQKDRNIWVNLGIEFFVFGLIILYWLYDYLHK